MTSYTAVMIAPIDSTSAGSASACWARAWSPEMPVASVTAVRMRSVRVIHFRP
jgi:hypothetical protein